MPLREKRIVHACIVHLDEFYTIPPLLSSGATRCSAKSVEKQRLKRGGNDVYPFARRILTRAAHDEEARRPKMASVTLVCYAIQHVHERLSKIARMPPRIGHCNQLLHSSSEVVCV